MQMVRVKKYLIATDKILPKKLNIRKKHINELFLWKKWANEDSDLNGVIT